MEAFDRVLPSRCRNLARLSTMALPAILAPVLAAQSQFAELAKSAVPPDEADTRAVAVGDIDGDGDPDVLAGNYLGQNRLYRNDGDGVFTDVTASNLPRYDDLTRAVSFGDVDGDGDLDVVLGNVLGLPSSRDRLYLNDGSGKFTDATQRLPSSLYPTTSLAMGDLDGDGDLDIVMGTNLVIRIQVNDGQGRYTEGTLLSADTEPAPLPSRTKAVVLGDVDGDGDLDLLAGAHGRQNRLYLNDGTGGYGDVTFSRMPLGQDPTTSVAMGDVDGDGDLDVVIGNDDRLGPGHRNRIYLNDGSGRYADATSARLPADTADTHSVSLVDTDADGDLDLVFGNEGQDTLYVNDGTGRYRDLTPVLLPSCGDRTAAMGVLDAEGDGDQDLFVGGVRQNRLYRNDGSSRFLDASSGPLQAGSDDEDHALGDVDGDGDLDLVLGAPANRLYRNDGRGSYSLESTAIPASPGGRAVDLVLGDVDGDGDLDLIQGIDDRTVASVLQNRLYLNDGTGTFNDVTASHLPAHNDVTLALGFGDFDGDGDPDLVIGNRGGDRLYLNDGRGRFADSTASRPGYGALFGQPHTSDVEFGDVDGDGDPDLVLGSFLQNHLYLNLGSGTYADVTASSLPVASDFTVGIELGDVDADGDLDMVVANHESNGQTSRLCLNDGSGRFTDVTASRVQATTPLFVGAGLGDVDLDGDPDMVVTRFTNDFELGLLVNDGNGYFTEDVSRLSFPRWRQPALGDVDGDGDPDLVSVAGGRYRIATNLRRQLHTPFLLHSGTTYALEAYSRHGPTSQAVFIPYLSRRRASIPVPPLGTVGIDPRTMVGLPPIYTSYSTGVGTFEMTVPSVPNLVGSELHFQALVVDSFVSLSNVRSDLFMQ